MCHLVADADHVFVLEVNVGKGRAVGLNETAYAFGTGLHLGGGGIVVAVVRVDEGLHRVGSSLVEDLREEPPNECV